MALQFPRTASAVSDDDAIHDNVAGEITAVAEKIAPATGDFLLIEDGADSDNKKKVDIANLPAGAPAAHAIGGAQHTPSLLADLNTKVSDATLDDSSASRPPTAHTHVEADITDLNHTDVDAIHDNVAGEIAAVASKATPVGADFLLIEDSAAANAKKSILISALPTGADPNAIHDNVAGEIVAVTEKVSPVAADVLLIEDSADSNNKKRVQITNLPAGTPADNSITNAKLADVATATLKGRTTAGSGDPEDLTATQARAVLNVEDGAAADQSDAEIKTAYENNADTNEFSDAEQTNLGNQSGTNTGDEVSATTTVQGIVELATDGEVAANVVVQGNDSRLVNNQNNQLDKFNSNDASFPATAPAAASSRNEHPVVNYDDTTPENIVFNSLMSNDYLDGSLTVDIDWVALTAVVGDVVWGVEVERIDIGGLDIDADSFAAQQTGTDTTNATSGIATRTSITLTQAQADSIAAGEAYRIRVQRVAGAGGDTLVGDAQLLRVALRQ